MTLQAFLPINAAFSECIFQLTPHLSFENAVFIRGRHLLDGGFYFTFPFPNAAFIGGRRLKEEIR